MRCQKDNLTMLKTSFAVVDELEEESSIQCTEPRSLTPESKRTEKIVKNDENVVEIDHSIPEMILREAIQHRGHIVADQGVEDHTSIRENTFEKDISKKSLSQYFGRSLDETRKIFGVSRTAFKKMCRDVGIKRWKYGERNMRPNSSKPRKRLNDEVPGRRNFLSGMPPVQDTPVVSCTNQNSNKMAVKATYNGVPIRFNLPDSSGLSELQDNVIKRLHLERNNFSIKYQDDEGEWVLIACDEDVQDCVEYSKSLKKTTIKMLLDPPVDKYAPKKQMT
ncbi:protein NLP5-like isoform X1 [Apium graveolens]|uniref:protein NLP5-like isoform X1 n=1 Tax=Apium graveolens TaxID=4045 RepID=UPI003D792F09